MDRSGLYTIGADGIGETRLTSGPIDTSPAWFPDGSRILFVRSPEGISEFHVVNADGTDEHRLAEPSGGYIGSVVVSPDGTRFAFTRLEPDLGVKNFEIFTAKDDGTGRIRLTHTPAPEADPSWSPDGRRIVFAREGDIYTMGADGSYVRQVTNSGSDGWPTWQRVSASSESLAPVTSPSPSASVVSQDCLERQSMAVGDFDGDGMTDTAYVTPSSCVEQRTPIETSWALSVTYDQGAGVWPMPDCSKDACRALGAGDLDGDGISELAVLVDQGASSQFVEFFEILVTDGPWAIPVSSGAEAHGLLVRGRFEFGGSVTHYAALGCDGAHVISETATLNTDQTEWAVHRTVLAFEPGDRNPHQFVVVSTNESTQPFDPDVGVGDIFEPGGPCWTETSSN